MDEFYEDWLELGREVEELKKENKKLKNDIRILHELVKVRDEELKRIKEENEKLREELTLKKDLKISKEALTSELLVLRVANGNLKDENEKLRKALEFYADFNNWDMDIDQNMDCHELITENDLETFNSKHKKYGGRYAREVLMEIEK